MAARYLRLRVRYIESLPELVTRFHYVESVSNTGQPGRVRYRGYPILAGWANRLLK